VLLKPFRNHACALIAIEMHAINMTVHVPGPIADLNQTQNRAEVLKLCVLAVVLYYLTR